MKNILITGIRGFIGFNAVKLWKEKYPDYNYYGLDAYTYADKIFEIEKNKFIKSNNILHYICNLSEEIAYEKIKSIVEQNKIDTIIHFAAESHVDNSIKNPNIFFQSNIIGTVNILNIAREYDLRVHIIGTDEVYGETTPATWHDLNDITKIIQAEDVPLIPSSPYSSSKAAADMIALSYQHTFGTKVTVSRCTNNFGNFQHPEKLIGTVILKALNNENIPVYGDGKQKRHWIHVDEHNRIVMDILEKGEIGKVYNIGSCYDNWITNLELIKFILEYLKKPASLIKHITDRLGHDFSYFLYGTNFCQSEKTWEHDMFRTIDWYKEYFKNNLHIYCII